MSGGEWAKAIQAALDSAGGTKHLHRRFHGAMVVLWALMFIPGLLWLKDSVPFLIGISIYANLAGHFAAWEGARAEEN